jgi:hypothetical protein
MDEQGAKQRRKPFLSLGAALAILAGAVAIVAIAVITVTIPSAAQKYLKLDWLQQPADYGFIGLAVLVWALI